MTSLLYLQLFFIMHLLDSSSHILYCISFKLDLTPSFFPFFALFPGSVICRQFKYLHLYLVLTPLSSKVEYLKIYNFNLNATVIPQTWHVFLGTHVLSTNCPFPTHHTKSACLCSPFELIVDFVIFLSNIFSICVIYFSQFYYHNLGSSHNLLLFWLPSIYYFLQPE